MKREGIIDVHNHPYWHGHTVDKLVRNMDRFGIETTWLLSWEQPWLEHEQSVPMYYRHMDPRGIGAPLERVVDGLEKHPDRFVGGWAPDPRDRYARARLKAAVDLHGIRICGELKVRMKYDSPDAISMFRCCGTLGLPVLFHLQGAPRAWETQHAGTDSWVEWYGGDLDTVETMCVSCPGTTFIGHGPGFWRGISADADATADGYPKGPVVEGGSLIRVLRACPNLYCDLSAGSGCNALSRDPEHAKGFLLEFRDRVLFGRDYFDGAQLEILEKLSLPEDVTDGILRGNAERLLARDEAADSPTA